MKSYIPQSTKLQISLLAVVAMLTVCTSHAATMYVGYADTTALNSVTTYDSTVTGGNPTGTVIITGLQAGGTASSFKPYGLALDTAGYLYVSDFSGGSPATGQIIRYNTNTQVINLQYTTGQPHPWGIAVSNNIVYTSAYSNAAVFRDDTTTNPSTPLSAFAAAGASLIGLAQDATGNIYVASFGAGTVKKYSATGVLDAGFSLSLTKAAGLALDGLGNLYVSSVNGASLSLINRYDAATGAQDMSFASLTTSLNNPYGIALDGSGNIFAANYANGTIYEYSIAGGNASATLFSTLAGSHPISLAFAPAAVPEPSSVALLCIGGLAFVSWRKNAQKGVRT